MFPACTALLFFLIQGPTEAPARPAGKAAADYLAEFHKLKAEMDKLNESVNQEFSAAKTEKDREAVLLRAAQVMKEKGRPLGEKALELARPHAAEKESLEVLTWVINYQPESAAASAAADLLAKHHLKDPQTLDTAARFRHAPMAWTDRLLHSLAEADLPRDRKARALIDLAESTKSRAEIPGMLKGLDPAMIRLAEEHYGKEYFAELRSADPAKLEAEALRRFRDVARKYGTEKYGTHTVADYAESAIFELQNLAIGKSAPDIEGEDIDGKKFKLSDYKGKVVVLDFWGHW